MMVASLATSSSARTDGITDPSSSIVTDSSTATVNAYQEEMCEKLIQLSFVKIVSSKSERGGARLRKNLLILHLLQRARMEQRNRFFASRNLVASQQQEVMSQQCVGTTTSVGENENMDHEPAASTQSSSEGPLEKIDTDASSRQQASVEPCPPPCPLGRENVANVSNVTIQDGETAFKERNADSRGSDAHASTILPQCDENRSGSDQISESEKDRCISAASTCQSSDASERSTVNTESRSEEKILHRACLKRKHDAVETASSSVDWNSSPKIACVQQQHQHQHQHQQQQQQQQQPGPSLKHDAVETASSSVDWNSSPKIACVQHQQQQPGPSLNELLSVLKTATLTTSSEENEENQNAPAVSQLSRSLSCSSFMELTCES